MTIPGALQRTNIRVSCNVEMTSALNRFQHRTSGMIFICPDLPDRTILRLSEKIMEILLFPFKGFSSCEDELIIQDEICSCQAFAKYGKWDAFMGKDEIFR